jgi:hypothetical protein
VADHAVYRTRKDQWGNIIALGGQFGLVSHSDAIVGIVAGAETYYVPMDGGGGALIEVADGHFGAYLRANWDGAERNNLTDLPDC